MDHLTGLSALADSIHLCAQHLGLFLARALALRATLSEMGHRLLGGLRFRQRLRVDVQGAFPIAELLDQDILRVECVLDTGSRLRAVGDRYHHRRSRVPLLPPVLGGLPPIVPQQIVGVRYQIGKPLLRLRLAVQVILHITVVVDVVEARTVRLRVGNRIVSDYHARRLDQAGLDGVVQAEIADDPSKQILLRALPPRRGERRRGEIVASADAPRAVNPVQTSDPPGGLLDVRLGDSLEIAAGRRAPSVMRLVVDDKQIPRPGHFAQYIADVCLVALRAPLVHAPPPSDLLVRIPIQRVPIPNHDAALIQSVEHRTGDDPKLVVVMLLMRRLQDGQSAPHGEAGRHDEDVLGEARVRRVGGLVQQVPRDDHRHDDSLAGAGRHLGAEAIELAPIAGNYDAHPFRSRRLQQPYQRLHRLQLTEEEPTRIELLRVTPMLQQPLGHASHPGIPRLPPRPDPRANLVDQRNLPEHARIVELPRILRRNHVPRRTTPLPQIEQPRLPQIPPVPRRLLIRRVHY